ncbi:MAG: hypothetical protein ACOZAQ_08555 [Pseudomonadota bacterium]
MHAPHTIALIIALGATTPMAPALADTGHPHFKRCDAGINARQHNQHQRIEQGVRSGQLTRTETRELAREQRNLRQQERAYKSDGVMTRAERKDMHQDLNAARKGIYEQKHDDEVQPRMTNP